MNGEEILSNMKAVSYIGMTLEELLRFAKSSGLMVRDVTHPGWYTSDQRSDRINVILDENSVVEKADIY
jgi:hypothetical protein